MLRAALLLALITASVEAEPTKAPRLESLPVIEVRSASPEESGPVLPARQSSTIELPPVTGQGTPRMRVQGRRYFGPYGTPVGPGRAWPTGQTGAPSVGPGGGVFAPGPVVP